MELDWPEQALATVAASGGVGAFIDFWLGKAGERRVRDWMETWWLRLSFVRLGSFGREEAFVAIAVMDRIFGRRLLSLRRLLATCITVGAAVLSIFAVQMMVRAFKGDIYEPYKIDLLRLLIEALVFAVSISITRLIGRISCNFIQTKGPANLPLYALAIGTQYILFCTWPDLSAYYVGELAAIANYTMSSSPNPDFRGPGDVMDLMVFEVLDTPSRIVLAVRGGALNPLAHINALKPYFGIRTGGDMQWLYYLSGFVGVSFLLSLFLNIGRFLLLAVFAVSFALRPLQSQILTLALRIIESDKPVFTLLFTGTAALASQGPLCVRQVAA